MRGRLRPLRTVVHLLEAGVAAFAVTLVRLMPLDVASAAFGAVARSIGPRMGVSRRTRRHITMAFPDMAEGEVRAVERGMWENLGRMVGEFPHMTKIWDPDLLRQAEEIGLEALAQPAPNGAPKVLKGKRLEVAGAEHAAQAILHRGAMIAYSAHMGNWEVLPLWLSRAGIPFAVVFRTPNNPYFARLIAWLRGGRGPLLPKGAAGAVQTAKLLEAGGRVGMLMDQKQNRGMAVPFFGRPAMTGTAIAKLAIRFRCPIYAAWVERLGGARFRVHVSAPLLPRAEADPKEETARILGQINAAIEGWIRARPDLWLWLHRRWPTG